MTVTHALSYVAHCWNGYPIPGWGTNARAIAELAREAFAQRSVKGSGLYE